MISADRSLVEWDYFLTIEEDLINTFSYVEPCEENMNVYSTRFANILLSSASETDTVLKRLCAVLDDTSDAKNEPMYRRELVLKHGLRFSEVMVQTMRYSLRVCPWENWSAPNPETPKWWTAYNNVKHHLDTNYSDANLGNAFRALSGLFVVLVMYYRAIGKKYLDPAPRFLIIENGIDTKRDIMVKTAGTVLTIRDNLPAYLRYD